MIIPTNRRIDWTPGTMTGVIGGIPNRTTIWRTISPLGGGQNDSPQIQSAINTCPVGQVVKLNAGNFRIGTPITAAFKGDFTIRGAGQNATILTAFTGSTELFHFGLSDYPRPPTASLPNVSVSGASKGVTQITVNGSTSTFVVGKAMRIQQTDPTWVKPLNGGAINDPTANMHATHRITAKTANTITFWPPLATDYVDTPRIVSLPTLNAQNIGVEDLTIDMINTTGFCAYLEATYNCWFKNVEIKNPRGKIIFLYWAMNFEMRRCYVHGGINFTSNNEGIDFYESGCWCLVEDNIIDSAGNPPIVLGDSQGGCVGNVIAYNFIILGLNGTNQNAPQIASIEDNHGPHNMMNLFEGNVAQSFESDAYKGSSSHSTLLRNWFSGLAGPTQIIRRAVALRTFANYYNVVGNVLGDPSRSQTYEYDGQGNNQQLELVYQLGHPCCGIGWGYQIPASTPPNYHVGTIGACQNETCVGGDPNVKANVSRHGNYVYAIGHNAIEWETTNANVVDFNDHNIPDSLYTTLAELNARGVATGAMGFPFLSPFNPNAARAPGSIPARYRFENGFNDPPGNPGPNVFLSGNMAFGNVVVGASGTAVLTISNSGTAPFTVTSVSYPTAFSGAFSGTIPAGTSQNVTVTFQPAAAMNYGGVITVNITGSFSGINTITCSGTGVAAGPSILLSGNLAFGNVPVGTSPTAVLTIANTGNATLNISGITYPSGFSGAATAPPITAGGSQNITVTFSPTQAQTYGGNIVVNGNQVSGVNTIACSGTGVVASGPMISLTGDLAFGNVVINQAATFRPMTISNPGTAALNVANLTLPNQSGNVFHGGFTGTIPAGGSQIVQIGFLPTAAQTYSGNVVVNITGPFSGNNTIPASGTGVTTGDPNIVLSGQMAFGNVPIGNTPSSVLTINNTGNGVLNIAGITYPSGFSGLPLFPPPVPGGGPGDMVTVTFAPTQAQAYGGNITVLVDASWQAEQIVGSGYEGGLAASGTNLYAIYQSGTDVYYRRSTNEGGAFGVSVPIATNAAAYLESPVVALGNQVAITYFQDLVTLSDWIGLRIMGNIYRRLSTDQGVTFGAPVQVTTSQRAFRECTILKADNSIHTVWMDYRRGNTWDIYYRRYLSGVPQAEILLASGTNAVGAERPFIAAGGGDVLHVVWMDARDNLPPSTLDSGVPIPIATQVYYRRSLDNGATWGTERRITSTSTYAGRPAVTAFGTNVAITYDQIFTSPTAGTEVEEYLSTADGAIGTFVGPTRITNAAGDSTHSFPFYDGAGNLHVAFMDSRSGAYQMLYRRLGVGQDQTVPFGLAAGAPVFCESSNYLHVHSSGGGQNAISRRPLSGPFSGTNTIAVSGTGIGSGPVIVLSGNLAFGNVTVGYTSTLSLTIQNTGASPLNITGIVYPAPEFSGAFTGQIPAGGSVIVPVMFAPTQAQAYGGNIVVQGDQVSGTNTIATSGTGIPATPIIRLTGNLAFGNVQINMHLDKIMKIENLGTAPLNVSSITYPMGFSGVTIVPPIPPGGTQNVTVTFSPLAVQDYGGLITVNGNQSSGTNTIICSGTGTGTGPIIRLVGVMDFGEVAINTSEHLMFTIENIGDTLMVVSGISYPNGFSGELFAGGAIPPGSNHVVTVTFSPLSPTRYGGLITVNGNQTSGGNTTLASGFGIILPEQSHNIALSGNMAFGNVTVGSTASSILRIHNNNANDPGDFVVSSISYPAGFSGAFADTVPASTIAEVTVTFAPVLGQTYSGNIVVNGTVNGDPVSGSNVIAASGTGTPATTTPPHKPPHISHKIEIRRR